jgi:hypothetical protein
MEHFHPKITNRDQLKKMLDSIPYSITHTISTSTYNYDGQRIIAIGDLHGDFSKLFNLLFKLEVIDDDNNWITHDTIIVQTGDIVDDGGRGSDKDKLDTSADELSIYHLLINLNVQARQHNGAVYICVGNHELMNFVDENYDYVNKYTARYYEKNLGMSRKSIFSAGSEFAKKLSTILKVVIKLGNNYFCHGGLPSYIDSNTMLNNLIPKINSTLAKLLSNSDSVDMSIVKIINDITWDRTYGSPNVSSNRCNNLDRVLNGGRLIIGHTIQQHGITSACNNRVFRIDTGMSDTFNINGRVQALVING